MLKIIQFLLLYTVGAALLAGIDTYLPFIPPATPFMAGAIYLQDMYYLFVLPVGVSMGVGTALALYVLRRAKGRVLEKIQNQKFSNMQHRLSKLVDLVGDFAIVVAHCVGLGAPIAYIYVLVDDVNYKTYTIYTIVGRTLLLSLFVAITNFQKSGSQIYITIVIIAYVVVIILFIIILIKNIIKYRRNNSK